MKIKIGPGQLTPRVLADGRTSVIPRFTAYDEQTDESPRVAVEMDVELDDWGRPRCLAISIRSLDAEPVTGATLRDIPLAHLLEKAAIQSWTFVRYEGATPDGGAAFSALSDAEHAETRVKAAANARRPRRGSPMTTEHLREVADTYRAALPTGAPTRAVCERWDVRRPTASRWVAKAREIGLLGPAVRGRAAQ